MHEMSLVESVVEILQEEARRQAFARVRTVWLEVGALSHCDPEALAFCFDVVTRGSLAEGARLEILRTPGQGWCLACSRPVVVARRGDPCDSCGSYQIQVTGGDAMRIQELEVD